MSAKNITIAVDPELFIAFNRLCLLSGTNKNEYGKALLAYAVEHELVAGENISEKMAWVDAVKSHLPLPKVRHEIKAGPPLQFSEGEKSLRVAEEQLKTKRKSA